MRKIFPLLVVLIAGHLFACTTAGRQAMTSAPALPLGTPLNITAPSGLPPVEIPAENPLTAESVALGQRLFYDPILSRDNTLSCASCHNPAFHFADGQPVARGINGQTGTRNVPTVLNAAFNRLQFWDGRAASLEKQVGAPIADPKEMDLSHDVCLSRLNANPSYSAAFDRVFGSGAITMEKLEKVIASFERTLLSGNAPFDRYRFQGDKSALSAAALRGFSLFQSRGNCIACHTFDDTQALFTDHRFHNLGVGVTPGGELSDAGRYAQTQAETDRGAFRTPSLRNVARTAPYMHDGSLKTLDEVLDFYARGGNDNPHLDPLMLPLRLSAQERRDLIAFLESLTGNLPSGVGPPDDK